MHVLIHLFFYPTVIIIIIRTASVGIVYFFPPSFIEV